MKMLPENFRSSRPNHTIVFDWSALKAYDKTTNEVFDMTFEFNTYAVKVK